MHLKLALLLSHLNFVQQQTDQINHQQEIFMWKK